MSDKLRGALFNSLGDISCLTILDAFAGSGALSLEAASRGSGPVVSIDPDRSAQQTIEANIKLLGLQKTIKLIRASANAWLSTTDQKFDIVLCDPPYDDANIKLLEKLAERAKPGGVIVFSLPPNDTFSLGEPYKMLHEKNYGDATLSFYRRLV
jgi:16S rRNA (guanine(966)-N(2))-methyltransferase RsmD